MGGQVLAEAANGGVELAGAAAEQVVPAGRGGSRYEGWQTVEREGRRLELASAVAQQAGANEQLELMWGAKTGRWGAEGGGRGKAGAGGGVAAECTAGAAPAAAAAAKTPPPRRFQPPATHPPTHPPTHPQERS